MNIRMRTRYLGAITADLPPDTTSNVLIDENFDGSIDGEFMNLDSLTGAVALGGTLGATLSFSSEQQLEGGYSVKVNGTVAEWVREEFDVREDFKESLYWHHDGTPGGTGYIGYLYAADGTTVAARFGITSAGKIYIQDGTTGTGAADDLSVPSLTNGWYRLEPTAGHGGFSLDVYSDADTDPTLWDSLVCTMTETSFAAFEFGLKNTIAGGTGVVGNLVNENFDGATSGAPTSTTMPGWTFAGSGVLTHSTAHFLEGVAGLRSHGTGSHIARKALASHTVEYGDEYFYYNGAPGGSTTWMISPLLGDNSAAAFQIGIDTTGKLHGRDSINGTGGASIIATTALSTGNWYRIAWNNFEVPGSIRFRYYTGATRDAAAHASAVQTLTFTCAAANFADFRVGQMAGGLSSAPDIYFDRLKIDSAAEPSPIGVTTATPLIGFIERLKARSDVTPDPITISENPPPPPLTGKLVPPVGVSLFGASVAPLGSSGSNPTGLAQWVNTLGLRPHIIHWYKPSWNGVFTAAELNMLKPASGRIAIPYVNIKPGGNKTFAQIAAGAADAELDKLIAGLKGYPRQLFLTLWHEADNNSNMGDPGYTAADYKAMFRYVVNYYNAAIPQSQRNVVWVWNTTGYSGQRAYYSDAYPGDDVVDWIAWDPYAHAGDAEFADNMNETDHATGPTWTGFYIWATTPRTDFSGAKPLMLGEFGVDFRTTTYVAPDGTSNAPNGKNDANATIYINTILDEIDDYPQLKAIVYWNSLTKVGDYQITRSGYPNSKAAFTTMLNNPHFAVDLDFALAA